MFKIKIVPEQPCPVCGAYWGNPIKELDFPNRVKVDDWWKCYNPDCPVGYYKESSIELKEEFENLTEIEFFDKVVSVIRKNPYYVGMHSAEPFAEGGFAEYKDNNRLIDITDEDFDNSAFDERLKTANVVVEFPLVGEVYTIYYHIDKIMEAYLNG